MSKVEIIFKGGAKTVVKVKDFTVNRGSFGLQTIEWTNGRDRIAHVNIDEIAAVIYR